MEPMVACMIAAREPSGCVSCRSFPRLPGAVHLGELSVGLGPTGRLVRRMTSLARWALALTNPCLRRLGG